MTTVIDEVLLNLNELLVVDVVFELLNNVNFLMTF